MAITLPKLPYSLDALEPQMSRETLEFHYGKHHKTYVEKTNKLIAGTEFENASLEDIVLRSQGDLFNNAAQVWNHNFFWNCLTPRRHSPSPALSKALTEAFGSVDAFKEQFSTAATTLFGSGYAWLVKKADGRLAILPTQNAANPMTERHQPLLNCDVWEHAYYIDYRNARPKYLQHFWALVNWDFMARNLGIEPGNEEQTWRHRAAETESG